MTTDGERVCLRRVTYDELWRKCVLLFCHHQKTKKKKKVPRMIFDGISTEEKKLRKNSRLGFSHQKKRSTQNFCLHTASSQQERTTKRALEGVRVCVCVCVCRFRE